MRTVASIAFLVLLGLVGLASSAVRSPLICFQELLVLSQEDRRLVEASAQMLRLLQLKAEVTQALLADQCTLREAVQIVSEGEASSTQPESEQAIAESLLRWAENAQSQPATAQAERLARLRLELIQFTTTQPLQQ